jgi:hypothetical protein
MFRSRTCIGVLAVLSAAAQTGSPPQQISAHLGAAGLKADVSFLASDALQGRGTPSPGLDAAAEFIASQFRRAGLDPAGDDGYFQTAQYVNVKTEADHLEFSFESGGQSVKVAAASMAFLEPAALDLTQAPVLRVSSDAKDADVAGKVVLLEADTSGRGGRAASMAVRRLAGMKPALLILVPSTNARLSGPTRLREKSAPVTPILTVWDSELRKLLAGGGPATVTAKNPPPAEEAVQLKNVIGVLRGTDPALKDTYVLLTAHYDHVGVRGNGPGDHIYNGANDDASGTASVIEIALALSALPQHPKRTIVFLTFFGEELGLVGSRYYAAHAVFPLAKTVADINLEQLGRTDDNTGPRVGLVNVTGFDFTSITGELRKAGEEMGIRVVKDEQSSDPFYAQSDNQAFADAGVPSHTLSVGYIFPDYHQASDEWPKLDYENMAKVDRTIALALWRLADNATAPAWNADNPKTEAYRKMRQESSTH